MSGINKPAPDEIEVSILGGGNGYGECIVIHAGYDHWIIVDSAKDPTSKRPLALAYFDEIDVNPEQNVQLILATHWHDDHIGGLAEVVAACKNAEFACSQALENKQFLILLGQADKISTLNSGAREFSTVFNLLEQEKRKLKRAVQDRTLLKKLLPDHSPLEVFTLFPSDGSIQFFEKQLEGIVKGAAPNRAFSTISPNHSSVVTVVKIGDDHICLGGDLENTTDDKMGWKAVLNAELLPQGTVSVFKVPHHGSVNAYCPEFWKEATAKNPIAGLTPFAKGPKKLPSHTDITNIYQHTDQAYITAPTVGGREKKRDPKANKLIRSLGYNVREIPFSFGQVRLRKKIGQMGRWAVTLNGKATELKNLLPSAGGD